MATESIKNVGNAASTHAAETNHEDTSKKQKIGSPVKAELQKFVAGFRNYYTGPLADVHLIVTICIILSILGVVMVLDASGPASLRDYGNYYTVFIRQCIFMLIGWLGFYVALRIPFSALRKLAFPLYIFSFLLLILVAIPGVGQERNGARSWFVFGPVAFQPSELAKVIIIVVVALYLGQLTPMSKIGDTLRPIGLFIPIIALVIVQRDLGMAVTFGVVLVAFLFFSRLPNKVIWITIGGAVALFLILTLTTGFRTDRLIAYWHQLKGGTYDAQGAGYQSYQSRLALADGGFSGVGLGQSRAKYFYLPEAPNDFIFAIIGEELGLIGSVIVTLLYTALGLIGLRIARRVLDPSMRLIASVGTTSIVVQAFINMGYVAGALPVTGLQLPLISAGGSATVTTLFLLGLITSTARHERAAVAAISTGSGRIGKALHLSTPHVYSPDDVLNFGRYTGIAQWMVGKTPVSVKASRSTDPRRADPRPGPPRAQQQRPKPRPGQSSSAGGRRKAPTSRGNSTGSRTLPPLDRPQGRRWNPPPRGSYGDNFGPNGPRSRR